MTRRNLHHRINVVPVRDSASDAWIDAELTANANDELVTGNPHLKLTGDEKTHSRSSGVGGIADGAARGDECGEDGDVVWQLEALSVGVVSCWV